MSFDLILVLVIGLLILAKSADMIYIRIIGGHVEKINVAELKEYLKSNKANRDFLLLDVRTDVELKIGKIGGSVNVDYRKFNPDDVLIKNFREKPIVIYCESGSRSKKIANKLARRGFPKIYFLGGGYKVWRGEVSL